MGQLTTYPNLLGNNSDYRAYEINNESFSPHADRNRSAELGQLTHVKETNSGLLEMSHSVLSVVYKLNATRILEKPDFQVYQEAISLLENLFAHIDNGAEPVSNVSVWICEFPGQLYCLLHQGQPFALIILAHYCVLLRLVRSIWWISAWAQRVIIAINRTLDPAWRLFIEWALHTTCLEG